MWLVLNLHFAKFDFISVVWVLLYVQYIVVLKVYLFDIEFGTVITFEFIYTCWCVFFFLGVRCDSICEMSFEFFLYIFVYFSMVYLNLKNILAIFCVGLLWCVSVICLLLLPMAVSCVLVSNFLSFAFFTKV